MLEMYLSRDKNTRPPGTDSYLFHKQGLGSLYLNLEPKDFKDVGLTQKENDLM